MDVIKYVCVVIINNTYYIYNSIGLICVKVVERYYMMVDDDEEKKKRRMMNNDDVNNIR